MVSERHSLCELKSRRIRRPTPLALFAFVKTLPTTSYLPALLDKPTSKDKQELGRENKLAKMTTPSWSTSKVLVYQHRHNAANPIVNGGLAVMESTELDTILENRKCPRNPKQKPSIVRNPC
jgi:hypothetical protein